MNHILKEFKQRLFSGETGYGPFMKTVDPAFVDVGIFYTACHESLRKLKTGDYAKSNP